MCKTQRNHEAGASTPRRGGLRRVVSVGDIPRGPDALDDFVRGGGRPAARVTPRGLNYVKKWPIEFREPFQWTLPRQCPRRQPGRAGLARILP